MTSSAVQRTLPPVSQQNCIKMRDTFPFSLQTANWKSFMLHNATWADNETVKYSRIELVKTRLVCFVTRDINRTVCGAVAFVSDFILTTCVGLSLIKGSCHSGLLYSPKMGTVKCILKSQR